MLKLHFKVGQLDEPFQTLTLKVPMVTNVNFLLAKSIHCQEMRL